MTTIALHEIAKIINRDRVITRRDHPELASTLSRLARRYELAAILPGVYVSPSDLTDPRVRILAASRWLPGAVFTGRAAAKLTFWPDIPIGAITLATRNGNENRSGFTVARRRIPPELVCYAGDLAVTTPSLTALDLIPEVDGDGIDTALRKEVVSLESLRTAFDLTPYRKGNAERAKVILDSRDNPWSRSERGIHRIIRGARLPKYETNYTFKLAEGTFSLDVAWLDLMVGIEVDGWKFHGSTPELYNKTMRKHNAFESVGWRILHFTWHQITEEPEWVLKKIRMALG